MKNKRNYSSILVCILWWGFLAICSGAGCNLAQSQAVVKDVNHDLQDVSSVASAEDGFREALSQQWHTFLWDSLPAEWLQDSNQAVLLQAYQENDWKPLFITAQFEVNASGHMLLQRLGTIQNEAIDPRPYKLEDLRYAIANLDHLRLSLQTADPAYRDSAANSSDPASAQKRPVQGTAQGNLNTMGPSAPPAADLDGATGQEERYRDLFRASSAVDVRLAHNFIRFANTMNPFSKERQVSVLLGHISMDEFLKEIEPSSPAYASLLQAFQEYQAPSQLFKPRGTDGKVGLQKRESLNISFQGKTGMIAQALKFYRESPTRLYQKYIWVNIPQFTLEYHNEGRIEAVHRVIVGKASGKKIKLNGRAVGENQTPTLASSIEQVVINPKWYVTDRIRLELNDAIAADPSFMSRNGYMYLTSARRIPLDPTSRAKQRSRSDTV